MSGTVDTGLVPALVAGAVLTLILLVVTDASIFEKHRHPRPPASGHASTTVRHVVARGHWVAVRG